MTNWYKNLIKIGFRNDTDTVSITMCQKIFENIRTYIKNNVSVNQTIQYDVNQILSNEVHNEAITKLVRTKYKGKRVLLSISIEKYEGTHLANETFDVGGLTLDYGEKEQKVEVNILLAKK